MLPDQGARQARLSDAADLAICGGTCAFFDNASPVSPTVDYTTGLVTFGSAPTSGHTLTWTGQFDTPCRFDIDDLKIELVDELPAGGDLLCRWASIPLIELRV